MFPLVLTLRSLARFHLRTETSFTTEDPWNRNRQVTFTVEVYVKTFKWANPSQSTSSHWTYLYGICSELDGIERMLPAILCDLWRSKRIPVEVLPRLLKDMEPTLKKCDYRPAVGRKTLIALCWLMWAIWALVVLSPLALYSDGNISPGAAVLSSMIIAGSAWMYMYLLFYRVRWRRTRQTQWILARV